jgi:hypothetical protein
MGTTRDVLSQQLNFRLGNRSDPAGSGELRVVDMLAIWLNAAYVDLAARPLGITELEETVTQTISASDTGHPRYALPADNYIIRVVRDNTNGKDLDAEGLKRFRRRNSTAQDRSARYTLWRNEIIFDPPLSTGSSFVAQLDLQLRPVGLSLATSESILPLEWDEVIVTGAEFRALSDMGLKDEAAKTKALFNVLIGERTDRVADQIGREKSTAVPDKVSRPGTW